MSSRRGSTRSRDSSARCTSRDRRSSATRWEPPSWSARRCGVRTRLRSIVLLDGDALRASGPPSWVPSLVVDPYYTALYRFITTSDLIFRTGLKQAYGPNAPHITQQEIERWQRPFRVAGTATAFKQMIPHGIQGWTPGDLLHVHVPALVAWGAHDTTDDCRRRTRDRQSARRAVRAPPARRPPVDARRPRRCRAGDRDRRRSLISGRPAAGAVQWRP